MIAKLASTGLLKVIRMSTSRLYPVILLLVIGCQQAGVGADKPALPVKETITEAEFGKQLKINRDTLLKGTSEQIRIDAATVMLFSENPLARKILLTVLKQTENNDARTAVCKALNQARAAKEPIKQSSDFIQPLLGILATEDFDTAKPAAEATLIFEYRQIAKPLEKIVTEASQPIKARLNAIYALKLQPDKRAILKLIKLLDDPDKQIAAASEKALRSLGMPVGKDAKARRQITNELNRKGRDEFLRDWQIHQRQEDRIHRMEKELDLWRKLYLASLDQIYTLLDNDTAKGEFLAKHLSSSEAIVRLWALERVSQWRLGTESKLPAEIGPILVNLVSDENRDVRLNTAKLLSLMGELNSAEKLLEQLKVEQNDQVQMELFVALGGACYYAFLPNSKIKISPEIRKQTLEHAAEYLSSQEPKKAQKGAEVIKKLLEQNGLTPDEVDRYLGLLAERYKQQKNETDGTLRGELLNAMAGLCAQSVYKDEAKKLFKPLFEEALRDKTNLVREAAVDGLVHIDKVRTLKILRKDFVNDSSIIVRKKLIELAGEVGGREDLVWLSEKTVVTAESEPAWQAMLKIFKRSGADVLNEWINKFDSASSKAKISDEQKISVLEIAERKAIGENKLKILKDIREKLAEVYIKNGEFERAAEYLGLLRETAETPEEKETLLADLLDVYLKWPNAEAVSQLIDNCLLQKDLEPDSVIARSIENYLSQPPDGADVKVILDAMAKIKTAEARPIWQGQLKQWADRFGQAKNSNNPKKTGD